MYKEVSILMCVCLTILLSTLVAASIGVSPAGMDYEKVLKGGSAQREFRIFNTDDTKIFVKVYVEGDFSDWFSFQPVSPIEIPAKGSVRVTAIVNPSSDTANDVYKCAIYVQPIANITAEGEFVMGLTSGAGVRTSIEVTGDQILSGEVSDISTRSVEKGNPVLFTLKFLNTGNVKIKPDITIEIKKGGRIVDSFKGDVDWFNPGQGEDVQIEWSTKDRELGNYKTNINVSLGDELLNETDLEFSIMKEGSFLRRGRIRLNEIKKPGETKLGEMIEIQIPFENTGEVDIKAQISAQVFLNEKLVDTVKSDLLLVEINKTETLTLYYKPKETGDYLIRGDVTYEGKRITINPMDFTVVSPSVEVTTSTVTETTVKETVGGDKPSSGYWWIVPLIVILAVVALLFFSRKKNPEQEE